MSSEFGRGRSALVIMTRTALNTVFELLCEAGFRVVRVLADTKNIDLEIDAAPDLVVIDTTLQPIRPAAFIKQLREFPRSSTTPVIVITTSCDDVQPLVELHEQTLPDVHFINIPIRPDRFLTLAESLLTRIRH